MVALKKEPRIRKETRFGLLVYSFILPWDTEDFPGKPHSREKSQDSRTGWITTPKSPGPAWTESAGPIVLT